MSQRNSTSFLARVSVPEAAPSWSLGSALLTVGFALIALIAGASMALVWLGERDFTLLAGWTLGGIAAALFVWQTRRHDREGLRLNPPVTPILFVMFIAFGCAIGLDLIGLAVTGDFAVKPELAALRAAAPGVIEWALAIVFMVIVQPIFEGLVFRGVTLPALRTIAGAWGGIAIAAALAGVFHMLVYPPNASTTSTISPLWYGLVVPVVEALVYGVVRASTGSTRAAVAAHVAFGVFAVIKLVAV